ncbi:MarR family transcriptional regulator [Acidithrix sp. C25]|uniref:MarR family winged helix-turn-helix transcriptional regulator n=1 Tax=Acidithrix sp. C25 TaxID=1671482 RepID=UPI00191BCAF7|nr:MarR family transcriptional regulator [Acidithrix sp. C25]
MLNEGIWLNQREQNAWRKFLTLNALLMSRLDADLVAAHSISLAEYEVLVHLSEALGGTMRMSALANACFVSRSGLTRRLEHMVAAGFVEKTTCPTDRRGMNATITPLGFDKLNEAAPTHVNGVRRYFLSKYDEADLDILTIFVDRPIEELESVAVATSDCDSARCPSLS